MESSFPIPQDLSWMATQFQTPVTTHFSIPLFERMKCIGGSLKKFFMQSDVFIKTCWCAQLPSSLCTLQFVCLHFHGTNLSPFFGRMKHDLQWSNGVQTAMGPLKVMFVDDISAQIARQRSWVLINHQIVGSRFLMIKLC